MEALLYSFSNRVQNSLSWLTDRAAWDERLSELCLESAGMLLVNRGTLVLAGDCLRMHQRCAAGLHRDGDVANLLFQGTYPSRFESPSLRRLLLGPVISVVEVFPLILVMRTPSVETLGLRVLPSRSQAVANLMGLWIWTSHLVLDGNNLGMSTHTDTFFKVTLIRLV